MKNSKKFSNILIIRTDRIGDVVLTTPAIKAIYRSYPGSRICVLVTPATFDLVNGNPYVDEILVDDRQGRHKNLFGFLRLTREIRLKRFDLAVIYHTKRRCRRQFLTHVLLWLRAIRRWRCEGRRGTWCQGRVFS